MTPATDPARHYLDHASTSPLRPEAVAAMSQWLQSGPSGDPSRVHAEGRAVRAAVEGAREEVAAAFGVSPRQIVFVSGATEAVNTATWAARRAVESGTVVCTAVEHSCVLDFSRATGSVEIVPVDRDGRVDAEAVADTVRRAAASGPVALVHCQLANHEVGTIQPVAEVASASRDAGVPTHCDAAAAAGHVSVDFTEIGADMVSISAHKLGGPPGVGALVVRRGLVLEALLRGGSQERHRRAGMENLAGIVGFGAAAAAAAASVERESHVQYGLLDRVLAAARALDGVDLIGPADPGRRLPHVACLTIDGVRGEGVVLGLDAAGIAIHSGSSCSSEVLEPSPVLAAMGADSETSIRISAGWSTTSADIDAFADAFPAVVGRLRGLATRREAG